MISSLGIASASMNVHGVKMQVATHNIANISTDGFRPQFANFATGSGGRGVELETVSKVSNPFGETNPLNISGTDIAREMPQMIMTQRGFEANAATIVTADSMLGTLVDMIA